MRRGGLTWLLTALALALLAGIAAAQPSPQPDAPPAMLVADRVFVTADRKLIAEGNVEAFQGQTRLRAARITFDRASGRLTIDGPIRIDEAGRITVLADSAELDEGLQNGILSGARVVMDQQLQMAALQMTRVGGRYSQLFKTAVTSCHVCGDGRPPLWQIRARKVTHDQLERQLYFEGAQLLVLDVPVFYLPAMRLPDPTLERATGFLIPSVRSTSQLGFGVRIPYFFRLGDSRDLTLSPYVSAKTRTLDFRYRQALRRGGIGFAGAFTRDDLIPGEDRGYIFGAGRFELRGGYQIDFDIKATSDDAYLVDYGLPDYDRLRSELALTRVTRDSRFRSALIHYDSLRDGEDETTLPTRIVDLTLERRFHPAAIGGEVRLGLDAHAHQRTSDADIVGRDVARATFDVEWRRAWIFAGGLRADWRIGASADTFEIGDDSAYPERIDVTTPRAAVTLRYPMTRTTPSGATQFLEPILQLGWTRVSGGTPPDDESGFVEFDQGNLVSLSRFPAPDRREDGPILVYGLNWARHAPSGWQAAATIGQVIRADADPDFTTTSGLAGTNSDILLAGQLWMDRGLVLSARGLLTSSLSFSKAELRGDWNSRRVALTSTYLWLATDPAEGRTEPVSELWFDGRYVVSPQWTAGANLRYDIEDARATRAGVGLTYQNECLTVDLSLNRRYTSTTSVEPSTDFGFTIALNGFAVDSGTEKYRRSCNKT